MQLLLEILENVSQIAMDAIYNCNRLDSQSDYSFIPTHQYISLLELEIKIHTD